MIKITREPVTISIERPTKLLLVKQGESEIKMTKNDINCLKMLKEGKIDGGFVGKVTKYRYRLQPDGVSVLVTSPEDETAVYLSTYKRSDDFKRIESFRDKNRPRLAFDGDLKRWTR